MLIHVHIDGLDRVYTRAEFEEHVREGTVGPETPVREGSEGAFRAARELSWWSALADDPGTLVRRALARPRVPWMTALIVGIPWRVHAWLDGEPLSWAQEHLAKLDAAILERGEAWRVLTYALLHGSLGHVTSNLLFLLVTGVALEALIGPWALGALFLGSVAVGGTLSALWTETPSIGASAADFGFLAAAAIAGGRWGELIPRRARPYFGGIMALYLVQALWNGLQSEDVDNLAHIGGALTGALVMALLQPDLTPSWRARNRWTLLGTGAIVAGCLALLLLRPIPLEPAQEDGLLAERPASWSVGYAPSGDRGWVSPLGDAWVIVHTEDAGSPQRAKDVAEAARQRWSALPGAKLGPLQPADQGGVEGFATEGTWKREGEARQVTFRAWARGHFTHVVAVDVPEGDSRREPLRDRIFESVALEPLAASKEIATASNNPRSKVHRARALARVGELATARQLLAEARAAAGTDPVPTIASLEVAAAWETDDARSLAEEALKSFPDDRATTVAAVRALDAGGAEVRANEVLRAAWATAPGDRSLSRLARELDIALEEAP